MRSGKKFEFTDGKYYFTLKASPSNITMNRESKAEAAAAFQKYLSIGKTVEWLGRWEGKRFVETSTPSDK